MKKQKKKIGYIIGTVALCVLLAFSGYISLVIVGVVADGNKNGTLKKQQSADVGSDNGVYTDNGVVPDNGYVADNSVISPTVGDFAQNGNNTVNNNNAGNVNNTGAIGSAPSQNGQSSVGTVKPQQNDYYLNTKKSAADIVSIYATVMNKAKAEKPGFKKVEYQELPGGDENRVISQGEENVSEEAINKLFGFVEDLGVFVPKEKALAEPYIHEKGDEDMSLFPVFSREKGSYLTDPKALEKYSYDVLPNGNVKLSFVLVSEDNPEPIAENSNVAPSYTGAVFSPMSKERIDGTVYHPIVTVFAKDIQYSLRYHDCYVEVEFNPNTLQIVNLKQLANVSIKGSGDVVGIGIIGLERQELYSTVIINDMKW